MRLLTLQPIQSAGKGKPPQPHKKLPSPPPGGCRHFKRATCSWPAPLSHHAARKGKPSQQPAQVWERWTIVETWNIKAHSPRFVGARCTQRRIWKVYNDTGSAEPQTDGRFGLHRWQLIGVSPLRPSAADNRDTGAGPLSTTAPPLRLFISRGSEKAASGREENYGGRTEGRDGHVTQTSLTVELAWELELRQERGGRVILTLTRHIRRVVVKY